MHQNVPSPQPLLLMHDIAGIGVASPYGQQTQPGQPGQGSPSRPGMFNPQAPGGMQNDAHIQNLMSQVGLV